MAWKPYGWGKFLCLAGLPWLGFSGISWIIKKQLYSSHYDPMLLGPGICGATLLVTGAVLLFVDWGLPLGPITT